MTIVHSFRALKCTVDRWALASRSALTSFPRKNRTISLHPIVTLLTLYSNSWTTQAWQTTCDVAKPPNAQERTYRVLKRYTEVNKSIQISARDARLRSVWAVRLLTRLSVPRSLITSLMTERCLAQATINQNRPSLNLTLLTRCAHRPEKNVSQIPLFLSSFCCFV